MATLRIPCCYPLLELVMPGMMDTVLNLYNDRTVQGLIAKSGNERFAYDSYRRFVQMYGDVVLGVDRDLFGPDSGNGRKGVQLDMDLDADD